MEAVDGAQIYNALNTSNIIVHRPYSGYELSLPISEVVLPCINVETISIEEPNGIVAHKYDKGSGNLHLAFNVQQTTPLGTHPLIISCSAPETTDNSEKLQLSYTVNEAITKSSPTAKDSAKMNLYTSEIEGSIELNLRDYVFADQNFITDEVYDFFYTAISEALTSWS